MLSHANVSEGLGASLVSGGGERQKGGHVLMDSRRIASAEEVAAVSLLDMAWEASDGQERAAPGRNAFCWVRAAFLIRSLFLERTVDSTIIRLSCAVCQRVSADTLWMVPRSRILMGRQDTLRPHRGRGRQRHRQYDALADRC